MTESIPSPASPEPQGDPTDAEVAQAQIDLIAAWHKGCVPVTGLTPPQIPNPCARALWFEIIGNTLRSEPRSPDLIYQRAQELAGVKASDWEAFRRAVERAGEQATGATMRAAADVLIRRSAHDRQVKQEGNNLRAETLEQLLERKKQEELPRPIPPLMPSPREGPQALPVVSGASGLASLPASGVPAAEPRQMPLAVSRLTVHTALEVLEPDEPIQWLMEPLLAPACVVMFYGESDSKKTYSLFSAAACLVTGREWLHFQTRKARVLIVDEESGKRRMRARLRECLNGILAAPTADLMWVTKQGIKLDRDEEAAEFEQLVRAHPADLVIIDSLSQVTSGDENSKEDMKPPMSNLRSIAEHTNACMLLIHHSRKDNEIYRGSTAIKDSLDLMVRVDSKRGTPFVNFSIEKNRDGEAFSWSAKAVWVAHPEAPEKNQFYLEWMPAQEEVREEKRTGAKEHILAYLEEHGESSLPDIIKALDGTCSETSIRQAATLLEKDRAVLRTNPGARGSANPARYLLSESEEELVKHPETYNYLPIPLRE